eukprot:1157676-Pelagomonas_calceolata.AAC.1
MVSPFAQDAYSPDVQTEAPSGMGGRRAPRLSTVLSWKLSYNRSSACVSREASRSSQVRFCFQGEGVGCCVSSEGVCSCFCGEGVRSYLWTGWELLRLTSSLLASMGPITCIPKSTVAGARGMFGSLCASVLLHRHPEHASNSTLAQASIACMRGRPNVPLFTSTGIRVVRIRGRPGPAFTHGAVQEEHWRSPRTYVIKGEPHDQGAKRCCHKAVTLLQRKCGLVMQYCITAKCVVAVIGVRALPVLLLPCELSGSQMDGCS